LPTYQYACRECGHAFEQVQSFSDDALTACPECQGRLRKVFNAVGVVFKGSGFYRNDSRGKESSAETSAPAKTDSAPAAASSTSSDSSKSGDSSSSSSGSSGSSTTTTKSPQPTST
jgi:putative FmdB family regulatory protein